MSSSGKRERKLPVRVVVPNAYDDTGKATKSGYTASFGDGVQLTESESHRFDRELGHYVGGGPFYTSRAQPFVQTARVKDIVVSFGLHDTLYAGPILGEDISAADFTKSGYVGKLGSFDKDSMSKQGTTAISLCNPVNPASNLGTGLAEAFREGVPSLPGIQSWEKRASLAKSAGSEYLNYIFGWAPLVKEIDDVGRAARRHRDIMNHYHGNEGKNTHRRFDFPLQHAETSFETEARWPLALGINNSSIDTSSSAPKRTVSLLKETKSWFEGCFTYALPSDTDSWTKAIGFGSDADQLFGLQLTPSILWELTPWSWAVDWFSNAGEVINNVTNFGAAGLVMRYGYMMMETTERVTITTESANLVQRNLNKSGPKYRVVGSGSTSRGYEVVTKRRVPASPFGFSVGWEGLSPTQLAITAALGITRLL